MATMIPENVEIFTTVGEKQFYRFLESVAKPDSQYTIEIMGFESWGMLGTSISPSFPPLYYLLTIYCSL